MLLIQGARQKAVPRRIMGTSCRNAEPRACPIGSPAAIPIPPHLDYVRFTLESRHSIAAPVCPLCATSGQMHCSKRILFGRFELLLCLQLSCPIDGRFGVSPHEGILLAGRAQIACEARRLYLLILHVVGNNN